MLEFGLVVFEFAGFAGFVEVEVAEWERRGSSCYCSFAQLICQFI